MEMNRDSNIVVYKNILQNMNDAVLAIDLDGNIITFNPAASEIFEIDRENAFGGSFGKLFVGDERNDDFNDVVLRAIYESDVTHHKSVEYYVGDSVKYLNISTTSLLVRENEKLERKGVIVVASDVTGSYKLEKVQTLFGRYIDPKIAERLYEETEKFEVGERCMITANFTDMKRFTMISSILPPHILVLVINSFYTHMSIPIQKNKGIIDKYIGDATMAFWGPPFVDEGNDAICACLSALGQFEQLVHFNQVTREIIDEKYDVFPFEISTGIASGEVTIGSFGSENRKSFTIMGGGRQYSSPIS